jgi:hypothetical protein
MSKWQTTLSFRMYPGLSRRLRMAGLHGPCRRFADTRADACARLGADAARYSFIAVDLHHPLLAGLPAHLCKSQSPSHPHRARTSVGLAAVRELAVELGAERKAAGEAPLCARRGEAESRGGAAPLTVKLAPGRAWKAAPRLGSLAKSCVHASLARSASSERTARLEPQHGGKRT